MSNSNDGNQHNRADRKFSEGELTSREIEKRADDMDLQRAKRKFDGIIDGFMERRRKGNDGYSR